MIEKNLDYSNRVSGFPENRFEALEESRRLLGLTESDLMSLLKIICRADHSMLDFSIGKMQISLGVFLDEEVCLNVTLEQSPTVKSIEYKFRPDELGLVRKQRRLHDFAEE